jgi:HEAT repeat protein
LSLIYLMDSIENLIKELTSGDDERAEASVVKIAAHGPGVLSILKKTISSSDPDVRWWALRAAAEIPSPETSSLLIAALDDPDTSVRQCAALGLRLVPDPQAVPRLIACLDDRDPLFASLVADALIAIGEPAVPALLNIMESGAHPVRLAAVRALALIGDKRAIPVLFAALDEDSALMEYWAGEGLERLGVGMTFFNPE